MKLRTFVKKLLSENLDASVLLADGLGCREIKIERSVHCTKHYVILVAKPERSALAQSAKLAHGLRAKRVIKRASFLKNVEKSVEK